MAEPYYRLERQWRFHSSTRHICNVQSKYRFAPDGTVNLLVGPEVAVTGGIVEIHF